MKVPLWTCIATCCACSVLGFFGGLAITEEGKDFIGGIFKSEHNADVVNPKRISTDFYQLEYPRNWILDETDPDFDLENYVSIESGGDNFVTITFAHYESDLEEALETYTNEYVNLMRKPTITRFSSYGAYTGKGKRIEGKIYGLGCTVDVFCGFKDEVTFTIVECSYNEDATNVTPGFDLIESSFKLKTEAEQGDADQPTTAPDLKPEAKKSKPSAASNL